MERQLRWYDYVTINIFWFGKTTRNQTLTTMLLPLLVQQFVGESYKGTYLGIIRLWALMLALLIQSLMGMVSDNSVLKLGRRRPFIIIGTIAEIIVLIFIGHITGEEGMTGYWLLFSLYLLSMVASDTGQGAVQGLIPDLVPDDKRGRISGMKALLELPIPLIFSSLVISKMVSIGNYWRALIFVIIILFLCMLLTMFVPEKSPIKNNNILDWRPFFRLILMTGVFTIIILSLGAIVKWMMGISIYYSNTTGQIIIGGIGLISMLIAIIFGVWICVNIGVGKNVLNHTSYIAWVINRLAFLVGATNISGFMIYFLQERFEYLAGNKAAGPASTLVMFVGLSILLATIPSGWLSDRFGQKLMIILSSVIAGLGTLVALMSPSLLIINIGGCLIGIGIGIFYTANWALGTKIVPKEEAGKYLGMSNIAGAGAGAIGAYIGGPIADSLGYVPLFIIYGVLFVISAIALKQIKM